MSFLLAKILVLLLLSAALGALLARWWLRRHYEDVTTEYTRLTDEAKRWREGLEDRLEQGLAQRLAVDLEPVMSSLQSVQAAVQGIDGPRPVAPDLSPVLLRLQDLEERLLSLCIPQPTTPSTGPAPIAMPVDLEPVLERLRGIEDTLNEARARLDQLAAGPLKHP